VIGDERPSPALRARFYAMLEEYPREEESRPVVRSRWSLRGGWAFPAQMAAAAALLVAAFGVGRWSAPPQVVPVPAATVPETPLTLISQPSAGQRLKGVTLAGEVEHPDDALVNALLDTLDRDPNVNVRLQAAESLFLFASQAKVRERLTASLGRQSSPLVQVALIDILVASREKRAAEALAELIKDRQVRPEVRDHAAAGIKRMF
jgi:hypothetical protein